MTQPVTDAPSAKALLTDPTASSWLKSALRSALERDIVDALNDALVLVEALDAELRLTLGLDEEALPVTSTMNPSESPDVLVEDDARPP